MDDLLWEFLAESTENLLRIEREVVKLENRPVDADLLSSIFRSIHTMKGTRGFLGHERLEAVAHATEGMLGALSTGSLEPSAEVISDVLATAAVIRGILDHTRAEQE
ncbi:MAG: Hpt domain-containing protein [Gemmatimonadota bacterium]